jgi:cysteine synthase
MNALGDTDGNASQKRPNVFSGPSAMRDFLDPAHSMSLPLVELPDSLNPFRKEKVRIFAKLMYLSPLFNIKLLAALNLLTEAHESGKLEGVHTIVENSSGNMVLAESVVGRMFGIKRVLAIVPRDIAPGKLDLLRLFGVDPLLSNESPGEPSGIAKARELGNQPGFFNPGQYENDANPRAYEKWLAPQIWEETDGMMTIFCAGLGTTGTIVGASRYLRKKSPGISIVGVTCKENEPVPGVRSVSRLKEIKFDWRASLDHHFEVTTKESFRYSLELCRVGLMGGPSSGFALAGLMEFLEAQAASALDALRNKDGEVVAVFVCPDSALLYLEKYSTHLDPQELA